ncbi:hypothetical protein VOLCADRAFT_91917 [Volvox carteri f. nagariensis]|uniref:Uncharacterized protein n=1 Tax=Volvox carteri f. nagariensis TaxID=3068 RepID=D8TYA6_VOLCA|nr:uncharacterized protein VOLCADRAFT_91917 [Volvox carteri f. nagariensis]EFJ47610.1 hypothetical protein VOLCADRAFT_91917 [Volvox carteri f. nagariensis]|eukprot:XP_002951434.1 hypothetical protein VOLCADRAFT_91917 [Volvox carteri f. nagariensis]
MHRFLGLASRLRSHALTQLAVAGLLSVLVGFTLQLTKLSALDSSGRQYNQGTYAGKVVFLEVFGVSKAVANLSVGWLVTRFGYVRTELAGWLLGLAMPLLLLLASGNGSGSSSGAGNGNHHAPAASGWPAVLGANAFLGVQQGLCWSVTVLVMILTMPDTRRGFASGLNEMLGYAAVASAAPLYGILESRMVRCGWAVPPEALSAACSAAAAAAAAAVASYPASDGNATAGLLLLPPPSQPPLLLLDHEVCTSAETWDPACLGECQCRGYDHLLQAALLVLLPAGLLVTSVLLAEPSPAPPAAPLALLLPAAAAAAGSGSGSRSRRGPVHLPLTAGTSGAAGDGLTVAGVEPGGKRGEVAEEYLALSGWRRGNGGGDIDDGGADDAAKAVATATCSTDSSLARGPGAWLARLQRAVTRPVSYKATFPMSYGQLPSEQEAETRRLLPCATSAATSDNKAGAGLVYNNGIVNVQQDSNHRAALSNGYIALHPPGLYSPADCGGSGGSVSAVGAEAAVVETPSSPQQQPSLPLSYKAAASFEVALGSAAGLREIATTPIDRSASNNSSSEEWFASVRRFGRAFLYYTWRNPSTASMCLAGATSNALTSLAWGLLLTWARDTLGVSGPGRNLLTMSYSFLKGLVQLLSGAVSDSTGRKGPVLVGLLLNAAGLLTSACGAGWGGRLLGSAVTPPQRLLVQYGYLMLGSCLMGSGAGVFYPVMPAAVVDHHHQLERQRGQGYEAAAGGGAGRAGGLAMTGGRIAEAEGGEVSPGHSMAAAMATYRFWRDLGYAIGALGGPVADWVGVEVTLMVAAAACVFVAGVVVVRYEEQVPTWGRRERGVACSGGEG